MGVMSDGSYGVPKGINFSFPVTCAGGDWAIVQGISLSDHFSHQKFQETLNELLEEKETAMGALN